MKITITNGDDYLLSEHVYMNEEGVRMQEEAAEAKRALEEEHALNSTRKTFQNTMQEALSSISDSHPDTVTTAAPGTLDSYFDEASATYGVDKQLLLAVARLESNFTADATSYAGAMGIMQLMPSTAAALGVENAYDARENIMGGAQLLADLLDRYDGDTSLALAAYNAGSGTVASYGNTVPPSIQPYVDKVMAFYAEGVQAPDAGQTTTTETTSEIGQNARDLQSAIAKFPEHQSYDRFIEELTKELSDETLPSDTNDAYNILLSKSRTVLDRIIPEYQNDEKTQETQSV